MDHLDLNEPDALELGGTQSELNRIGLMVRRSHRGGLGSASFTRLQETVPAGPTSRYTCGGAARWNTGTQPGACDGRGWGLGVQHITFLYAHSCWRNRGTRLEACDSPACDDLKWGLSATALTWFHEWAGGVLLGNLLLPAGERGGRKRSRDALVHHCPPLEQNKTTRFSTRSSSGEGELTYHRLPPGVGHLEPPHPVQGPHMEFP